MSKTCPHVSNIIRTERRRKFPGIPHPRQEAVKWLPILLLPLVLPSCHTPPPMTAEEHAESRRRLHEIEDENFYYRDRERRSAGEALRTANTGAPPVHYHQHRTYAPQYGW